MKRNHMILIVAIVAVILAVFPTPRSRQETIETLVYTVDCSQILKDGYQITRTWTSYLDKIVINVQSNEEINIKIKITTYSIGDPGDLILLYDSTLKNHDSIILRNWDYFEVTVTNPSLFGFGAQASMSGSIKGYQTGTTTTTSWLPWWMP